MCSRGGVGMRLGLSKVPVREEGITPYELMLSESQERMVIVAHQGREEEVASVFHKWGVDAEVIGSVIAEPRMELLFGGEVVANLPIAPLVEDAPVYERPYVLPVPERPGEGTVPLGGGPDDAAALRLLLASPNVSGKEWITSQYDWSVQGDTVAN